MKIQDVQFQLSRIPLPGGTWGDQIHTVTHIEIITADITADDGTKGVGFTHTSGVGGRTILAMLEELRPQLIGRSAHPRSVWHDAWHYLRDSGPGGVTTLALAAIDIALWDLLGNHHKLPLADLLGRVRDRVHLYGSGINLHLSADEVADQVENWKNSGYGAAKVKVGKPDVEEDVERLTKIRERVGQFPLAVDANQGWTQPQAIIAANRFEHLNLLWLEEPIRTDDVEGHRRLRERSRIPLGLGENLYTLQQFNQYFITDTCDFVQTDVGRVGGITPYMAVADTARAFNLPMTPHFIMELSAHVLCAVPNVSWAEMTEGGTLTELGVIEPQPIVDGWFVPRDVPGHGLNFDRDFLTKHEVTR
ncbi:mandelate racemase/muconate lactonizing enzyme family protein [Tessaracoccus rhinocerotis]|uniref:Mandelate racemase/muconate lactonizing enzyme family protein n=1 Tax=Tessaracoccus rhinocerotis TaxID=1689449 RepID=A0A553JWB6_9ACTN|nr:mandelate racemase/muconate lactonizing enzyme family protein [Tessaracoccus rhinocerotis]TRY16734.1 mandelate racemase/muconate lactonizing enzyme family protein [Tessaracoccus rhinocerotis]